MSIKLGELEQFKKDIESLFYLTQNKIMAKDECLKKLNELRRAVGLEAEMTKEFFDAYFERPPATKEPTTANVPKNL